MATVKHHKVVAALPAVLEPDAIYYVRAGAGFDQYVTNGAGLIVASPLNADALARSLDPSKFPSIRPSLRLDFVNNQRLDPRVTFTRASGGGRFNASGQYEWLPANEPRIDYDPVTGECLGLLIEEQRTNLLTRSSDFSNAEWTKTHSTVVANAIAAPDGTITGTKLVESSGTNLTSRLTRNYTTTAGSYSWSILLKKGERSWVRVLALGSPLGAVSAWFNLETGTKGATQGSVVASMTPMKDGWYRCSITFTSAAESTTVYAQIVQANNLGTSTGDGTSGIYIWGAQLEAGAFPTSYIPTEGAQVTRAADIASVNELAPWYNQSEGTLVVEWAHISSLVPAGSSQYVAGLFKGVAMADFNIITRSDAEFVQSLSSVASADQGAVNAKAIANTTPHKAALVLSGAGRAISVDGADSITAAQSSMPAYDRMCIGNRHDGIRALNGHIRVIKYLPRKVSDSELQAMTQV